MKCWGCGAIIVAVPCVKPGRGQLATVQVVICPRCDTRYTVTITRTGTTDTKNPSALRRQVSKTRLH